MESGSKARRFRTMSGTTSGRHVNQARKNVPARPFTFDGRGSQVARLLTLRRRQVEVVVIADVDHGRETAGSADLPQLDRLAASGNNQDNVA